jgi:peptidoglycan/xylan/chitin deacetylase (PgdA/CDA1 family)
MYKKIIKQSLQLLIARLGPHRLDFSNKKRLVILTYHRVLPIAHSDIANEQPGMYVHPNTFSMHMKLLKDNYEVTDLSDWIHRSRNNENLPKLSFAITFDDGWKDNYEYAYPVLKELNIPATIFLVSDYIGSQYSFWPNRLLYLLNNKDFYSHINYSEYTWLKELDLKFNIAVQKPFSQAETNEIIERCKEMLDTDMINHIVEMEELTKQGKDASNANILNHKELQEMLESGLIHVGSHTCNHIRMIDKLDMIRMNDEIVHSKSKLEELLSEKIQLFCYPNGDYTDAAVNKVRDNYIAAVTTEHGWNDTDSDPFLLRRIGLHEGISNNEESFISRLSGLI